tara:strand:+ start:142 stop:1866 length:1725 start_codon:yes stop_codon:yes gene_type:complete
MCGVYGITYPNREIVEDMIEVCGHRGPDGKNIYTDNNVCIGHNLLAITDQANQSLQPWITPKGNVLSYNGEIFNYFELREKYKNVFRPKTNCDTELLAWGLDQFGYKFIEEIDSMHAFAYYDKTNQEIWLSRDHAGVKPLYYAERGLEGIIFSSEIKNMLKYVPGSHRLSDEGLACVKWCGFSVLDQTIFNNIKKLTAGETLVYDLHNNKIKKKLYYRIIPSLNHKFDAEEFRYQVNNTVKMTSIGIRDFGIFLSGGLDSGIIAYEMNKINPNVKTFTNRFDLSCLPKDGTRDGWNDDADVAKILAQQENFNHKEIIISPQTLVDNWQDGIKINEEAIMNFNMFAYHYTNAYMKKNGITITMAGDMGDELLGGYYNHLNYLNEKQIKTPNHFIEYFSKISTALPNFRTPARIDPTQIMKKFKKLYVDDLWNGADPLSSYLAIECLTIVPDQYLTRNDKLGMNSSIEGRFPFTTKAFKKYCFSIPSSQKIERKRQVLKKPTKIAYKNILPKEMLNKVKSGWSGPIGQWLSNNTEVLKLFNKNVNLNVPAEAGAKTWKVLGRQWIYEDWKKHYNIV